MMVPAAEPAAWDEMRAVDGGLRPAWARFVREEPELALPWRHFAHPSAHPSAYPSVPSTTPSTAERTDALRSRRRQLHEQIRRDGITHNVFGPEGAQPRPWSLELLPLLIEPADWALIEAGVRQRAQLLEGVMADLYGPRRLLEEGLLPGALVLRHPGYVRAMRGAVPVGGLHLRIVAFDIARGPDGAWWVVAQRTQGPSGLGYVLHNRLLVSRQFPRAYEVLRVQRLASSYRRLLDGLDEAARTLSGGAAPNLALLTPGPYSETWFEHAYLARYLGLKLVEGSDLTVRGSRLYMKTVEGLEPVHGLLRRLDDDWCDPLALRADSTLGVPGLVQAAHAGQVAMANALGSAFLESPAVQGFLPAIAKRLLGQALSLPSLPTWWCGEAAAWADVRPTLQGKLMRTTFPQAGRTSMVHPTARVNVDDDPEAWTVQGRLRFSRAPTWGDEGLVSRPAMVRVYAIAGPGNHWHVLPGGMTRVARREDESVSMQRGGTSLDTWVMTEGRIDTFSMLPRALTVDDIAARRRPVGSRTGENLFWLGRYTERCEQQVRLARLALALCGDGLPAQADAAAALAATVAALGVHSGLVPVGVPTPQQAPRIFERALLDAMLDARGSFSIAYHLRALAQAGQALRERLSPEQWRLAQHMVDGFEAAAGAEPLGALDALALHLAAMTGAQTDRMTRDAGWRLLTVGRLLERLAGVAGVLLAFLAPADTTPAPVDSALAPADAAATTAAQPPGHEPACPALASGEGVDALLELLDSTITFRARYQRREDLLALVHVLVLDDTNPRSLAGVLRRLRTELGKLPARPEGPQALADLLPAQGVGFDLESLRDLDPLALAASVRNAADSLRGIAFAMADAVGLRHFALAEA
jgi:uncharacterized circularly permuted ATP-grasp superfamily protein/uncharacterized alpha-E superfamily protein